MARWTLAGSVGVVAGPLALAAGPLIGLGWRGLLFLFAVLTLVLTLIAWRQPFGNTGTHSEQPMLRAGIADAFRALLRKEVLRWLVLLEFSDFMLDELLGFLALYLVDVVGVSPPLAGLGVAVWTGAGLLGDALIIPLLERVNGLVYLRYSAALMLILYPAFLLIPLWWARLGLLATMGIFNSGWYAILQGRLYSTMPGKSGTAAAVGSLFGVAASVVPVLLGAVAEQFGLPAMMWLLTLGPIALLSGIPHRHGQPP